MSDVRYPRCAYREARRVVSGCPDTAGGVGDVWRAETSATTARWPSTSSGVRERTRAMNTYGRLAQTHWSRWLPTRYAQIPDPESFFTDLGEQIQEQVITTADAISSQQPPEREYLARAGQLNMARLVAEEQVMGEMAYLGSEPGIEEDEERSEGPANQPSPVMDAQVDADRSGSPVVGGRA